MSRFLRLSLLVTAILLMIACGLSANSGNNSILAESVLQLAVQAQPSTFTSAGQVIGYTYTVTNNGTTPLTGPVTVTDNRATVLCPELKTVGNKDDRLDQTETITCAGGYNVAQTDVTAGNVTSTAQATRVGADTAGRRSAGGRCCPTVAGFPGGG